MTDNDRDNLKFLMGISPEGLLAWMRIASDDDVKYATWLMLQMSEELNADMMDALNNIDEWSTTDDEMFESVEMDCTEANAVIAQFTLGGSK